MLAGNKLVARSNGTAMACKASKTALRHLNRYRRDVAKGILRIGADWPGF